MSSKLCGIVSSHIRDGPVYEAEKFPLSVCLLPFRLLEGKDSIFKCALATVKSYLLLKTHLDRLSNAATRRLLGFDSRKSFELVFSLWNIFLANLKRF